jgi:phosphoribosylamine--glycine ligase
MPTRILVVGGGGREHALAWKLAAEPGVNEVIVAPGSDGIATEPRVRTIDVPGGDIGAYVDIARARAVELVVIGPEAPLAAGLADAFLEARIPVFGPTAAAAAIESSKAFCHEIAAAAGVPMARSVVARGYANARDAVERFLDEGDGVVVKQDELAGGKGVSVFGAGDDDRRDVDSLIHDLYDDPEWQDRTIVIEERLSGPEASLIAITDGRDVLALPFARDYKRLLDGDVGPNTGGMGAHSPLPDLPDDLVGDMLDRFHRPVLAELARRGTPFSGALYAGIMLTPHGPRLLEFNARFGDPETQVLLPRVATPLGPILLAAARGQLAGAIAGPGSDAATIPVLPGAAVGIVIAAQGYPWQPLSGDRVAGIEDARADGSLVFHSGTRRDAEGAWRSDGGRLLTVVGRGPDLDAARLAAERGAALITGPGLQRRRDIGAGEGITTLASATGVGA